jgi:hypothetical protein
MNLSDNQVSQAIAAVMGICWHEWKYSGLHRTYSFKCIKCGSYEIIPISHFTAFSPNGIWQWKSWMEKEMPGEWGKYLRWIRIGQHYKYLIDEDVLNAYLNPHLLVKYLFDNLDSWGYKNCWHTGYAEKANCLHCKDTGKVLTERARKFKAIVEVK